MTTPALRVERVDSLTEFGQTAWRQIEPASNFYQSYVWTQVSEATARGSVAYHIARTADGDLLGCLPVYQQPSGGNPGYDPGRFGEGVAGWFPHRLYGARSGYQQQLLMRQGLPDPARVAVLSALLAAADGEASVRSASMPFLVARSDADLVAAAAPAGWEIVPDGVTAALDLPGTSLDEYLESLPAKRRSSVRREIRAYSEYGFTTSEARLSECTGLVAQMATRTQRRHGSTVTEERMREALSHQVRYADDRSWVLQARHGQDCLGVVLHYRYGDQLYMRMVGVDTDVALIRSAAVYFTLTFYHPVRRARDLGIRRLWFGPGAVAAKTRRGARTYPLASAVRRPVL
ncbi:MAG: GNAT family N-acetyltransferase [Micromonosporaceae bacterium]